MNSDILKSFDILKQNLVELDSNFNGLSLEDDNAFLAKIKDLEALTISKKSTLFSFCNSLLLQLQYRSQIASFAKKLFELIK